MSASIPKAGQNRLAAEGSPYLLQHADNPVDWYPWGDEAFAKAKSEDKPVFLSVGYSTCHWCHVMAHESFESDAIAELLNANFVSIKVDREQRPDVDAIYMAAVQAMTRQGGWPMSVFMTPAGDAFFAGTYFPPASRWGQPGFSDVLHSITDAWQNRRTDLEAQGQHLMEVVGRLKAVGPAGQVEQRVVEVAVQHLRASYDGMYGGFGGAPKFPRSMSYSLLLRQYSRNSDAEALEMVSHTLDCMARGGIYDHLGGGFARYSVDAHWDVPHFEKMLYDNAQLIRSYLEAYQLTQKPMFERVVRESIAYVLRDLTDPKGGFYCAEDADSEGEEGTFYVWAPEEFDAVLGVDDGAFAAQVFGVTAHGNFEHTGKTVLRLKDDVFTAFAPEAVARLERCRTALFEAREKRIRPSLDDKVLVAWNGLMIGAMAYAHRVLGDTQYLEAAQAAATFVMKTMCPDGQLKRCWRNGEADIDAFLDDYVLLSDGLLSLYESDFDEQWVTAAIELMNTAVAQFWDEEHGGFFFSRADRDDHLSVTIKDAYDGAVPSGNSMAVQVLYRLYGMTGDDQWRARAESTVNAFAEGLSAQPQAYPAMICGLDDTERPPRQVVIAGSKSDPQTRALIREVWRHYLPGTAILLVEPETNNPNSPVAAVVSGKTPVNDVAAVYLCENMSCREPVADVDSLADALG
jgi:uncharacterized protein YyaL (SSP411 family)